MQTKHGGLIMRRRPTDDTGKNPRLNGANHSVTTWKGLGGLASAIRRENMTVVLYPSC